MTFATLRPKLFDALVGYDRRAFTADLVAGLTVGAVALPLAMAFGIASGVAPQAGIYTAIVGGFIVSLLGGSRIQIGGPTGAFVVIVAGIIAEHGLSGLFMVTMMAGVLLIVLAVTRLGRAIKFIPRPIVIGFTMASLLIASTQVRDFLSIRSPARDDWILRIHGPFLFGMTDKLVDATADLSDFEPIVVLRLRNMTAIDATGLHALENLSDRLKRANRSLVLCGARDQPARFLKQAEFIEHVGVENITPSVEAALARARDIWTRSASNAATS